uniref:Uncharacterized protein n=1 Tax=Trypanosoma congolense (strain IL3000) TaxID=1068625 RepID=G0V033_TRYCI|nr:conserved hypothetical protein [Trypanosoma congolense IL3000]
MVVTKNVARSNDSDDRRKQKAREAHTDYKLKAEMMKKANSKSMSETAEKKYILSAADVDAAGSMNGVDPAVAALPATSANGIKGPHVAAAKLIPIGSTADTKDGSTQRISTASSRGTGGACFSSSVAQLAPVSSMSAPLRRERDLLDRGVYQELCYSRLMRRQDPTKGFDRRRQSYVYYNHRSKGCYIPHPKDPSTITLTYNHLYDFADGTRFLRSDGEPPRSNPSVANLFGGTYKIHSRSGSPERGIHDRQVCSAPTTEYVSGEELPQRLRSGTGGRRTVSVDVARSLRLSDVRAYTFQKHITVEDVISNDIRRVQHSREGISSVVGKGKVLWSEVPEQLQVTFGEAQSKFNATLGQSAHEGGMMSPCYGAGPAFETPCKNTAAYHPSSSLPGRGEVEKASINVSRRGSPNRCSAPKQGSVMFTDHADRVVLGFTANVSLPTTASGVSELPPQAQLGTGTTSDGPNASAEVTDKLSCQRHFSPLKETVGEVPMDDRQPPTAHNRELLLPSVALAQLHDSDYFLKPRPNLLSDTVELLGSSWMPEYLLPYETSRLSYLRKFDLGEAKPLPNMIHWTKCKKLY